MIEWYVFNKSKLLLVNEQLVFCYCRSGFQSTLFLFR
jgi:hypothetical protein